VGQKRYPLKKVWYREVGEFWRGDFAKFEKPLAPMAALDRSHQKLLAGT